MKSVVVPASLFFLAATSLGCGMLMPQGGQAADPSSATTKSAVTPEIQDTVKKSEKQQWAQLDEAEDQELDKLEKESLKALRVALGKEAAWQGGQLPESSSTALKALRAAKFKMRLEPVQDGDGKAVNQDFFQLKDSYTDRVQQLQRKIVEQKASRAELKEVQEGAKQMMKLQDLRSQVTAVSMATINANTHVQTAGLTTVVSVAGMIRQHKLQKMDIGSDEYALVKHRLERQKRAEAIAATDMAMLAAYQAIINGDGDPKALDVIADGAAKAFPVKVEVSDADAKAYVDGLGDNVSKVKAIYEAQARKAYGDSRYERMIKPGLDAMFAQAENAKNQKSVDEIASDAANKYKAEVVKCKSGAQPDPGSTMSGPTCKAIFRAAQTGDTSDLSPAVQKIFDETGGGGGGAAAAGGGANGRGMLNGKAGSAVDLAGAAMNGDVGGMLDGASKLFGENSTIGASLKGISALRNGDAKGAISAALTFVPVPGLKEAFGFASKLLFKG